MKRRIRWCDRVILRLVLPGVWIAFWGLFVAATCPAPNSPSFFGVGGNSGNGVPGAYDRAEEAGLKWARIFLPMHRIMPDPAQPPNWDAPYGNTRWEGCGSSLSARQRISEARQHGMSVLGVLTTDGVPDASHFQAFATAAAQQWGSTIAAWELGNEPKLNGIGAAAYRNNILAPGYDGIKSVGLPVAIVAAPALYNPSPADISSYLKAGGAWVRPGLDVVSFHLYASKADVISMGNAINVWCDGQTNCAEWWLTEFGFSWGGTCGVCGETNSGSPGSDTTAIMDRCRYSASVANWLYCWRTFIFTLTDRFGNCNGNCVNHPAGCPLGLLKWDGTVRQKFCAVEFYVTGTYSSPGCP